MASARSLLPHYLALIYGLAIAYASLQPFAPWLPPEPGTPFFLFAAWPPRWTRADVIVNLLAYVPFGFFIALAASGRPEIAADGRSSPTSGGHSETATRDRSTIARLGIAFAAGLLLSFAAEWLQMFLPSRVASVADLVSNTAGAVLGAALALAVDRFPASRNAFTAARESWFLPGKVGDVGLALLAIWLTVQVNPGIPLFATTFGADSTWLAMHAGNATPAPADLAATLVEAAASALQLLGVGLFVALLLRHRRHVGGALLALIVSAFVIKAVAAAMLLKPAAWAHWLSPAVSNGVAVGALLLLAAIWLPRAAQVTIAAVALLGSVLTPLLTPDLLFARAPLSEFNWSYGQLMNFNGLTQAVLLVWPVAASALLFALAGRPGWGVADH